MMPTFQRVKTKGLISLKILTRDTHILKREVASPGTPNSNNKNNHEVSACCNVCPS